MKAILALACLALVAADACAPYEPPLTRGLTAKEHEEYFPIDTDDPHALEAASPDGAAISCTSCHDGTASFETAVCLRCHELDATPLVTAHFDVAGYEAVDASCLRCHPRGDTSDVPGLDIRGVDVHNELWFPIGPDSAHGGEAYAARIAPGESSCSSCHVSAEDRSQMLCLECHLRDEVPIAEAHGPDSPLGERRLLRTSFDLANDSKGCQECHAETPIHPAVRPVTNHAAAAGIETDHHRATCKECHQSRLPPPKEWAIDFRATSCIPCHVPTCSVANPRDC